MLRVVLRAALLATSCSAAAASPFDGEWTGRIDCPSNTESSNAKGYVYDFPILVRDGVLSGGRGDENTTSSLLLEGTIPASGDVTLQARGVTADPAYTVKHLGSGTPYRYSIDAHFDASGSGKGERNENRVCHFTFRRTSG